MHSTPWSIKPEILMFDTYFSQYMLTLRTWNELPLDWVLEEELGNFHTELNEEFLDALQEDNLERLIPDMEVEDDFLALKKKNINHHRF